MANTVNVTTANTFEEWRVKTNELGTKIGDLDDVTNSDIGATTLVAAVKAHQGIVVGSVTTSGSTMTGNMVFNDNAKVILGTSSDGLEIYHDGSHSYIADTGTGNLKVTAPTVEFSANVDVDGILETIFRQKNYIHTGELQQGDFVSVEVSCSLRCASHAPVSPRRL